MISGFHHRRSSSGEAAAAAAWMQVRPQSARDWLWVQVAQLPPPDPQFHSTSLERAYVRALQGRQARSVLERIAVAFDAVVP